MNNISESLAILCNYVEMTNFINLYNINIIAEDFYCGLLNLIFDYDLKNINNLEKNAKAIDLYDSQKRVSIQVTSDNDSAKIKDTIAKFIESKHYEKYDKLIILILTRKKKYSVQFDTKGKFIFDKEKDIIDSKNLIAHIKTLSFDKIKVIEDFLTRELNGKYYESKKTKSSEVETIIDLIEYISNNKDTNNKDIKNDLETFIDPDFKINKRFEDYADYLTNQFVHLLTVYGRAIEIVRNTLQIDEAKTILNRLYLQDMSTKVLIKNNYNPINSLEELVDYFENKLSENGKKYDRMAIKFYLISEIIECNVFPNIKGDMSYE